MRSAYVSMWYIALVLMASCVALGQSNTSSSIEKVKTKVRSIGLGEQVTVIRSDGKEFHGAILSIGDESFQIQEVDLKQTMAFKFDELKNVRKGYGARSLLTGKRHRRYNPFVVGAIFFGSLFALIAIGLHGD